MEYIIFEVIISPLTFYHQASVGSHYLQLVGVILYQLYISWSQETAINMLIVLKETINGVTDLLLSCLSTLFNSFQVFVDNKRSITKKKKAIRLNIATLLKSKRQSCQYVNHNNADRNRLFHQRFPICTENFPVTVIRFRLLVSMTFTVNTYMVRHGQ